MHGQQLTWCLSRSSKDELSLSKRVGPRSFFWCLLCDRGFNPPPPPIYCLPSPSFIVVSFLLNCVPSVDTSPISPSLKLLGVVVMAEKYGYVRYKALTTKMAAFPLDISILFVVFFCFSTFLFHRVTQSATLSDRPVPLSSAIPGRERILPMAEEGFFLGLGPWPNVYIDMGSPVCYPHNSPSRFFFSSPWEERRILM